MASGTVAILGWRMNFIANVRVSLLVLTDLTSQGISNVAITIVIYDFLQLIMHGIS